MQVLFDEGLVDGVKDGLGVADDFVVPESEDAVASTVQAFGSCGVCLFSLVVLSAVDFDDQLGFSANEVDDHAVDDSLTEKRVSV